MRGGWHIRCTLFVVGLLALTTGVGFAAETNHIAVTAAIDGNNLDQVDANNPLLLSPDRPLTVRVFVRNSDASTIDIRSVRLESKVLGLAFVTYTTRVDMTVPPGETGEREYDIDTSDLSGQATGLLPGQLSLLTTDRSVIASKRFAVDVKGSTASVYGLFGLAVAAVTALLLVAALVRLAAHRLPGNRWARATRFGVPAAGIGLTLTFTLSVLRLLTPAPVSSLTLVLVGAGIGTVFGYLTPGPSSTSEEDERALAELIAARSGEFERVQAAPALVGSAAPAAIRGSAAKPQPDVSPPADTGEPAGPPQLLAAFEPDHVPKRVPEWFPERRDPADSPTEPPERQRPVW